MKKADLLATNPLLKGLYSSGNFIPQYSQIRPEHVNPAISHVLDKARHAIAAIKNNPAAPDFRNTLEALENARNLVAYVKNTFDLLTHVRRTPEMELLEKKISQQYGGFEDEIYFDKVLFQRIRKLKLAENSLGLDPQQSALLDNIYKKFISNGAALTAPKKQRLYQINQTLAELASVYDTTYMSLDNKYMLITDRSELSGIPGDTLERAACAARKAGMEKAWLFNGDENVWFSVMSSATNRDLRKKYYRTFSDSGSLLQIMKSLLNLRYERAKLLGYRSHAEYQLSDRMVSSEKEISGFLDKIKRSVNAAARRENRQVLDMARQDGIGKVAPWDELYYTERLKEKTLGLSSDMLRPYLKTGNVAGGAIAHVEKLHKIRFIHRPDYDLWSDDVHAFDVVDEASGKPLATVTFDLYARDEKQSGAWCETTLAHGTLMGRKTLPLIHVVCNFAPPTDQTPSLLTTEDVRVLFHELGHATQDIFNETPHQSISGSNNTPLDFIEFASQFNENWALQPHVLDQFARHHVTGAPIPEKLKEKIRDSQKFMGGNTLQYTLKMSYLDLALHSRSPKKMNISLYEPETLMRNFPGHSKQYTLTSTFQHVASIGYDAGYYSYIWAEALEADGFGLFRQNGLYDRPTADKFKRLLAESGIKPPSKLYREFRGRDVEHEPLLKRYGLGHASHYPEAHATLFRP